MTDATKLARAVELIANSAVALRHAAPADAAALALAADRLLTAAPPAPSRIITPAQKRAAAEEVRAWFIRRQESWPPDWAPPTQAADIKAAAIDLPEIPRNFIVKARPPEWLLIEGRPRNSPINLQREV